MFKCFFSFNAPPTPHHYLYLTLSSQLISQEPNQGVEYDYYLPNGRSREGYYWSYGSWSACSKECGSGQPADQLLCFFYLRILLVGT